MTLENWMEKMMEEVEGNVFIFCVMKEVPYHENTSRYQVYNKEGTYDKIFDITFDKNSNIVNIE